MKGRQLHAWHVTVAEAREIQDRLREQVIKRSDPDAPQSVAGVDISVRRGGPARAAVVVLTFPGLELLETRVVEGYPDFPYIPGLLTFREAPLILEACAQLTVTPDLFLVDGQGIAHPRRFGIASHLGLLLDTPTIGCAKSRLCGEHEPPPEEAPGYSELTDGGEVIGAVLRSKTGTRPLYVSIGHRIDLPTAVLRIVQCCKGYRLPQPSRLAHMAAAGSRALAGCAVL